MTPRRLLALAAALALPLLAPAVGVGPGPAVAAPAAPPADHTVVVTGAGAATYPAFDPGVARYAVTTTAETAGTLTVAVTSTDPDAVVSVDGQVEPDGERTVTGLVAGDEVTVFVDDDAGGRSVHSYLYLPERFPTLERVTPADVAPSLSHVMLTLTNPTRPGTPSFETAVDANGVPALVNANTATRSMDLKRQPNGHYSVARGIGNPGYPNSDIVELDAQFREVARHRTQGLEHTDGHDSILLPDGSRYLMAYEPDPDTGLVDAVVQHIGAGPSQPVLFEWNSRDLLGESVTPSDPDYAHINSFQVVGDDLVMSFRHLSAVLKVARHPHDGFAAGDVVWRLGGRDSDFTFATASGGPSTGPCAQHTATELPDGHVMVFDNGSASMFGAPLCVDPEDPDGPLEHRLPTRIAEWALDDETGVATLVRDHSVQGRHSIFAGSAQPLAGGGVVVGWAPNFQAVVSELAPDGGLRWELRDTAAEGADRLYSYRAFALDLPDAIPPTAAVSVAAGQAFVEGQQVRPVVTCRDRGGSTLRRCDVTPVDTSTPGTRTMTVTARDGAGLTTTLTRRYRVVPRHQPDAALRASGSTRLVGVGALGARPRQQLVLGSRGTRAVTGVVRVRNAGQRTDRFTVVPTWRSGRFAVRVLGPTRTSPWLRPGETWAVAVRITPLRSARAGDQVVVRLDARSRHEPRRTDTVFLVARRR